MAALTATTILVGGCGRGSGPTSNYTDVLARKLLSLEYVGSITGHDRDGTLLTKPLAVTMAADGTVYVADRKVPPRDIPFALLVTGRVQAFRQKDGKFLFGFNRTGPRSALDLPVSLAVNPKGGNLFVADAAKNAVYEFTAKGKFVREILPPDAIDRDWDPASVAFDTEGNLRVLDVAQKQRVIMFEGAKRVRRVFGKKGEADGPDDKPGQFFFPAGLAVAPNGWMCVSDSRNRRLQMFDEAGDFEQMIVTGGFPRGIAIAPNGLILYADAQRQDFGLVTAEGDVLQHYGVSGFKNGQFNGPNDVALDPKTGWAFVVDTGNNRVQAWAPKGSK